MSKELETFRRRETDSYNRVFFIETDQYFIPVDMKREHSAFEWLVAGLKTTLDNLGILHRNLVGPDFFSEHENLSGYYEKMYEIVDDTIEIIIGSGGRELSIYEACQICPSLKVQKFSSYEAYQIIFKMFEMLVSGYERCKEFIPGDIYSKFEEYIYWMRKESIYKIQQRLKEK